MSAKSSPATPIWKEDPERTEKVFRALTAGLGPRIRSLTASRVVKEGPLSLLRVELDKVRRGDPTIVRSVVPDACVLATDRFHIDIDMLPRLARPGTSKTRGENGPFDRGPSDEERKRELVSAFRKHRNTTGIELHDNIYGRSIRVLGFDEGQWLLRTVFANGVFDRARMGREIEAYVLEGWWR